MVKILSSLAILLPLATVNGFCSEFPAGSITKQVTCRKDSRQSYTLYLPKDYTASRKWPILYAYDPAARGVLAVEVFKKAAEKYGTIVVGSLNSKNGPWNIPIEAAKAMWVDTHERFAIDPDRIYLTGFSGGARVASLLAIESAGKIAGVILCGAGIPIERSPLKVKFPVVGTAGTHDMNLSELRSLLQRLRGRKVANRLLTFPGGHQWPPPEVAAASFDWLELQAIRDGRRKPDPALVEELFKQRWARAKSYEDAHDELAAYLILAELETDFSGLRDVTPVHEALKRLGRSKTVKQGVKKRRKLVKEEQKQLERFRDAFNRIGGREARSDAWWKKHIDSLSEKLLKEQDKDAADMMTRLIEFIWRVSYERSRMLQHDSRAVEYARVAVLSKPSNATIRYNLARLQALYGHGKKALVTLRQAVDLGFDRLDQIRSERAFDTLRNSEEFKRILADSNREAPSPEKTKTLAKLGRWY